MRSGNFTHPAVTSRADPTGRLRRRIGNVLVDGVNPKSTSTHPFGQGVAISLPALILVDRDGQRSLTFRIRAEGHFDEPGVPSEIAEDPVPGGVRALIHTDHGRSFQAHLIFTACEATVLRPGQIETSPEHGPYVSHSVAHLSPRESSLVAESLTQMDARDAITDAGRDVSPDPRRSGARPGCSWRPR